LGELVERLENVADITALIKCMNGSRDQKRLDHDGEKR
jgi:hypothetical protein